MNFGTKIVIEAGNIISKEDIATNTGTTIIVTNLFFNTPVRYKFLKKDYTEVGYIDEALRYLALVNKEISFRLTNNGKVLFSTNGSGEFKNVIYSLYDREVAENIIEVENTFDDIRVYGVIGKPQISRSNRRNQIFFVNKRYITDKVFLSAVEKAYKGLIPLGRFGFCILNIEMNPAYVDVNVHPAKLEVRFSNEGQIFKAIYETVKQGLTKEDLVRNAIRYEHEGKGFKLEETKTSFEYLKPTFNKLKLNDKKQEQTELNFNSNNNNNNDSNSNYDITENDNQNIINSSNNENISNDSNNSIKNDRPAKSKIDEIIEAYRQKYGIDKNDDRINKQSMEEKVDNLKIEETEDLFGNVIEEPEVEETQKTKSQNTVTIRTLASLNDMYNNVNDEEIIEENENNIEISVENNNQNNDKTIYVENINSALDTNIEKEEEYDEDISKTGEVYNIENIIEEKVSGVSQNTDVIDVAEINKKLAEENELKFDEMYQKAFGTEISEKRKERLKNEEKIDGISTLKPAKNETVFRNSGVQYKVIGTVFRTYIIFEVKDEMYLLDQHAAHERILFEKVKSNYYKNEEKDIQTLLLPDIITLSYRENELAHENKEVFNKAGFEFEEFGINTVKLTAVPSMCEVLNTKELFLDILDEIDGQANSRKTRNRK